MDKAYHLCFKNPHFSRIKEDRLKIQLNIFGPENKSSKDSCCTKLFKCAKLENSFPRINNQQGLGRILVEYRYILEKKEILRFGWS